MATDYQRKCYRCKAPGQMRSGVGSVVLCDACYRTRLIELLEPKERERLLKGVSSGKQA